MTEQRPEQPTPQQIAESVPAYPEIGMTPQERRLFQIANIERRLAEFWLDPFVYRNYRPAGAIRAYVELGNLRNAVVREDPSYQPSDSREVEGAVRLANFERNHLLLLRRQSPTFSYI